MEVKMEAIQIDQFNVLAELQEAFANRYPFLKIDFFETDNTGSTKLTALDASTKLSKLPMLQAGASLDISCNRTVAEVTSDFLKSLGVSIQVSRKSGKVWNLITVTESWTLKTQNSAAEYICSLMKLSPI